MKELNIKINMNIIVSDGYFDKITSDPIPQVLKHCFRNNSRRVLNVKTILINDL